MITKRVLPAGARGRGMGGLRAALAVAALLLPSTGEAATGAAASATVGVGGGTYPVPPRQTPVQRGVMAKVQALASRSSQRAVGSVLRFLDEPAFRAQLTACCPSVASLSAPALYTKFKAEVSTMEVVHNWDPRPNGSPMDELNMSTWLAATYDYNLWQMSVLGLKHASFLFNCDLAEVSPATICARRCGSVLTVVYRCVTCAEPVAQLRR
jgi:hypothetical protein